jgi:hypothetical protein
MCTLHIATATITPQLLVAHLLGVITHKCDHAACAFRLQRCIAEAQALPVDCRHKAIAHFEAHHIKHELHLILHQALYDWGHSNGNHIAAAGRGQTVDNSSVSMTVWSPAAAAFTVVS